MQPLSPERSASRRPSPPVPRVLLAGLAAACALLAAGCSNGRSDFNGNRPDPSAVQEEVVRTPSPLGTDLPQTDPEIVVPLPGPSGGVPGEVPTRVPEASPGETGDGGGPPGN